MKCLEYEIDVENKINILGTKKNNLFSSKSNQVA